MKSYYVLTMVLTNKEDAQKVHDAGPDGALYVMQELSEQGAMIKSTWERIGVMIALAMHKALGGID